MKILDVQLNNFVVKYSNVVLVHGALGSNNITSIQPVTFLFLYVMVLLVPQANAPGIEL